jgi:hypothetical protein
MSSKQPIKPVRVQALPISSQAHTSKTARLLNGTNQKVTMHLTQTQADAHYDPPPPPRPTTAKTIEMFAASSTPLSVGLLTVAALSIVYSLVAK